MATPNMPRTGYCVEAMAFDAALSSGSIKNYQRAHKAIMKHESSYRDIQAIVPDYLETGSAAEAHGLLAGMLCMDAGIDYGQWLANLANPEEPAPQGRDQAILLQLFEETRRQLDDFDFSFEPLLPDDDAPLEERAFALGEWCQGFLAGLGYVSQKSEWPGECTEILRDFMEIARLDPAVSGEADESAYAELTEYVRVGVQVIHSELQSGTPRQLH
jgi:uncharacterized protein YgfB (UPF0149 family)